jgi:hypothetical protein
VSDRCSIRFRIVTGQLEKGYTLAGVLVLIGIMSVMMAMALPVWERIKQRENEEELIFRGKEYMEAIARYHTKFHSFPPDMETLLKMKFIRKLYKDPMTESGEWKLLHPGSLVETGEAGFINQPGSKQRRAGDQETEEEEDREGVIPGLSGSKRDDSTEDAASESEDEGDETSIGPVVGVVSRSKKTSLRIYNGQSTYDKWIFAYVPQQDQQPAPPPPNQPGKKQDEGKNKDAKPKQPPPKKPPG